MGSEVNTEDKDDIVIQALLILIKDFNLTDEELLYLETTIKSTINMIFKSVTGDIIKKQSRRERNERAKKTNRHIKTHMNERVSTGQILLSIVDKLESVFKRELQTINNYYRSICNYRNGY